MLPCFLDDEDGPVGRPSESPLAPITEQRIQVAFLPEPRRVAEMRRMTATTLDCAGLVDPGVVDVVQLLVSELVTNAVRHGKGGLVGFCLRYDAADEVRIEVDDHSTGRPVVRHPGPDSESGRGMLLVKTLALAWGRTGSCTWCTVPVR
ncbi:ATP-binding protein [Streptomyces sp. LP05-1]|uniref:ATP-binding protein n=1 Tax=Streptomyces pyxinae TaxID=2970734 RepID=A0ABT2CLN4_9ACTN|nr:ATP-binding protein [Streptomyces sp. LP05-1]MCS0638339.1 ATP-binding protein [Streptomyces sp. LP05-1]